MMKLNFNYNVFFFGGEFRKEVEEISIVFWGYHVRKLSKNPKRIKSKISIPKLRIPYRFSEPPH